MTAEQGVVSAASAGTTTPTCAAVDAAAGDSVSAASASNRALLACWMLCSSLSDQEKHAALVSIHVMCGRYVQLPFELSIQHTHTLQAGRDVALSGHSAGSTCTKA